MSHPVKLCIGTFSVQRNPSENVWDYFKKAMFNTEHKLRFVFVSL